MKIKVTRVDEAEKGMAKVTLLVASRNVGVFMTNFGGWLEAKISPAATVEYIGGPVVPPEHEDGGCMTCQKCFKCNCGQPECLMLRRRGPCVCVPTLKTEKSEPPESKIIRESNVPKASGLRKPPRTGDMKLLDRAIQHIGMSGIIDRLKLGPDGGLTINAWLNANVVQAKYLGELQELVNQLDHEKAIAEAGGSRLTT